MAKKIEIACIIDDDDIYVFGLKKMLQLRELCSNIMVFQNGQEALNHLTPIIKHAEHLPDVILLDVNMPVMNGWEFMEEFVKIKPSISKHITIYMVSSSISVNDIEKANKMNEVSDYIFKPITMEKLEEIFK